MSGATLARRRPVAATLASAMLAALALASALAGPICSVWKISPEPGVETQLPPTWPSHPLGTDDLGRDILARLLHGGRRTLLAGTLAVAGAALLGIPLGGIAAMRGGRADTALSAIVDLWMAFPALLLALFLVACLAPPGAPPGTRLALLISAVALVEFPAFFRQARAAVMAELPREYVLASRALGCGPTRLLVGRILPNAAGTLGALATLGLGSAILEIAGLGFLGLGVPPGTPEWGADIHFYRADFLSRPGLLLAPSAAVALCVLAIQILGDTLSGPRRRV